LDIGRRRLGLVDLVITYQARLVGTLKRRHRRLETQFRRDKTRLDPNITAGRRIRKGAAVWLRGFDRQPMSASDAVQRHSATPDGICARDRFRISVSAPVDDVVCTDLARG
jgi:hypothetical protein